MVKIRLRRMGARNRAFYRVVVSDSRSTPTASAVDTLGHYDPVADPPLVKIDREKLDQWLAKGAQLSGTVASLLKRAGGSAAAGGSESAASA
jgi:small subunit ribosomal protein S16